MTKSVKAILVLLVPIGIVGILWIVSAEYYSRPPIGIPKENIPSNIPADVRKEIEELYSHQAKHRGEAIFRLGEMRKKAIPAIPFLIEMLGDGARTRWSDYKGETSLHMQASSALVKMGKPAVELLIVALEDGSWVARVAAARALGRIKDTRVVEPLIAALKDGSWWVRRAAAWALGETKDPRAVAPLAVALKDKVWFVRNSAISALKYIRDPSAVEPLIAALKHKDSNIRQQAAWGLEMMGDSRAVEPLIQALKDRRVRCEAAGALGQIGDTRAVEPLIAALKSRDSYTRYVVVWALGAIRDRRAVEPLIQALRDKSQDVRREAADGLCFITGQGFGQDVERWEKWWEENKDSFDKRR